MANMSFSFTYTPPETDQEQYESMEDYATEYLLDFEEARFSDWMKMFKLQTQTEYYIQRGSHAPELRM